MTQKTRLKKKSRHDNHHHVVQENKIEPASTHRRLLGMTTFAHHRDNQHQLLPLNLQEIILSYHQEEDKPSNDDPDAACDLSLLVGLGTTVSIFVLSALGGRYYGDGTSLIFNPATQFLILCAASIPLGIATSSIVRTSIFAKEVCSDIKREYSERITIPSAAKDFSYFVKP